MKLNNFTFFIGLLAMVLLSGYKTTSEKDNVPRPPDIPYHINWPDFLNRPQKITRLSSIASSISYIKLVTPDSVKIGMIRRLSLTKDNIFIVDQTSSIFIFDSEGKFKNKISHVGRGPGEYPTKSATSQLAEIMKDLKIDDNPIIRILKPGM
jgi:hypothetical protein